MFDAARCERARCPVRVLQPRSGRESYSYERRLPREGGDAPVETVHPGDGLWLQVEAATRPLAAERVLVATSQTLRLGLDVMAMLGSALVEAGLA